MAQRITPSDITGYKARKQKVVCLTAYTAPMAHILDPHTDVLLVGDSVGMALYGMENTLGVTLNMMINHAQGVMRGSHKSCVIVDMPFGTYEKNPEQAHASASRVINETAACGVKLEGGAEMAETIHYLVSRDIPVMGHIGLLPQSVIKEGGYKIKGRGEQEEQRLLNDARSIEQAGAFAFVIEATIENVARDITASVKIPSIGIGASAACDGQVLVTDEMLGLLYSKTPKFVQKYGDIASDIARAAATYALDVRAGKFPAESHVYTPEFFSTAKKAL
ncbi:MAG: 3-methyl-2-oxobutanoate hydroxymethyltransferase [Alphaproteobacteria bacterium]